MSATPGDSSESQTNLRSFQHPLFSRSWPRLSVLADRRGISECRRRLVSDTVGRVIEIGVGDGLNFAHYPSTVTEVVAVEPNHALRSHAERNAESAPVPIQVVAGHADELPGEDDSFDCVVLSQVLCSVPDPASALREVERVLRPDGKLYFFEHVRSGNRAVGRFQEIFAPVWRGIAGGCEMHRRTKDEIERAGYRIETVDRFGFSPFPLFWMTYILGAATPN